MKSLTHSQLLEQIKFLVKEERHVTTQVLTLLREVERRNIHLEMGYASLHEFTVKELGYSDGAAHMRVSSMRLLTEIPEAEEKLLTGQLSMETMAAVQTHARREKLSTEQKREVLRTVEGKSKREAEKILTGDDRVEIKISRELLKKLQALQIQFATTDLEKVIERLVDQAPKARATASPAKLSHARLATRPIRREVMKRGPLQCAFVSPTTGKQCTAHTHLQFDHIKPYAHQGPTHPDNLRLLCSNHNRFEAKRAFGPMIRTRP